MESLSLIPLLRRAIAQRLMRSFFVVEEKVGIETFLSFLNGGVGFDVDVFIFDSVPQTLGEDVIHTPATSVHTDCDTSIM